jgi:hypothetical protein
LGGRPGDRRRWGGLGPGRVLSQGSASKRSETVLHPDTWRRPRMARRLFAA